MRGAGAYYSFTCQTHQYGYRTDIGFQRGDLQSGFYGHDGGLFAILGDEDLNTLSDVHPSVQAFIHLIPTTIDAESRLDMVRELRDEMIDGVTYADRVPAQVNTTYLLRSIHDHHEAADSLVALRIVRQDLDGSLIILWKELERFPVPLEDAAEEATGCG